RTLTNAIAVDRLPHAFILTGVRGVGKTSTARIISRALNCIGADGAGGATAEPCGQCEHCIAITADRHVDVLEMDAASRTGVGDIRELIDGVRYRPTSARYKIYIIDEVHMLSTSAFNALLKTLEEPPEHVKFIFATTEIRRVPVTVLSRCQRFDLRRVDSETLVAHFTDIAGREEARISAGAISLIAAAADGSVRDGLSILDQAITHAGSAGDGAEIAEAEVRDMLGLADGAQLYDLFDAVMKGGIAGALDMLSAMYNSGADPVVVLQDLLGLTHWLTRLKLAPELAEAPGISEVERVRGGEMAASLTMPILSRTWQMLLKGVGEARTAPSAVQAAEMILVRIAYAADLPAPAEIIAALERKNATNAGAPPASAPAARPAPESGPGPGTPTTVAENTGSGTRAPAPSDGPAAALAVQPVAIAEPAPDPAPSGPQSFEEVVALFANRREPLLHAHLMGDVHLVRFEPGHIEYRAGQNAPSDLANLVSRKLGEWTGANWLVSVSGEQGAATLREQVEAAAAAKRGAAISHPLVQAALETFPGATVEAVRDKTPADHVEAGEAANDEPIDGDDPI
ncbi:MAG: DNA polymerase III subunit gamma/tau, partial [Alphaproteobacteria bacterium]